MPKIFNIPTGYKMSSKISASVWNIPLSVAPAAFPYPNCNALYEIGNQGIILPQAEPEMFTYKEVGTRTIRFRQNNKLV